MTIRPPANSTADRPPWRTAASAAWLCCAAALLAAGCHLAADGKNMEGVSLLEQGNHQAAMQRFQDALVDDPRNADALYNLGSVYYHAGAQQGNQDLLRQAEGLYLRCLEYEPNHSECHRALAVLMAKTNRTELAFQSLQAWAQRRPDLADPYIELARLYEEFGDNETARRQLQEAITINVRDKRAWNALASLYEKSGEKAQALANYQRSLQIDPHQSQVATRLAALQQATGLPVNLPPTSEPGNHWASNPSNLPLR